MFMRHFLIFWTKYSLDLALRVLFKFITLSRTAYVEWLSFAEIGIVWKEMAKHLLLRVLRLKHGYERVFATLRKKGTLHSCFSLINICIVSNSIISLDRFQNPVLRWNKNKMSRDMTKPTKWVCAQRRLRSAWASAQSDHSLLCLHEEESLGP